jgi:hypothetical protein
LHFRLLFLAHDTVFCGPFKLSKNLPFADEEAENPESLKVSFAPTSFSADFGMILSPIKI